MRQYGYDCLELSNRPFQSNPGEFLAAMQTEEGGLRADSRIPVADLLSTFYGLGALALLERE